MHISTHIHENIFKSGITILCVVFSAQYVSDVKIHVSIVECLYTCACFRGDKFVFGLGPSMSEV